MLKKSMLLISVSLMTMGCGESNDLGYTREMQIEDEMAAREHQRICASAEERKAHPEEGCPEQDN